MSATAALPQIKSGQLFIDGAWVDASSDCTIPVINPATGETLTVVQDAGAADVDRAVQAARRAFESGPWATMNASERERILWRVGDLIEAHKDELALLESLQNGKTVAEAHRGDLPGCWDIFRYYAGWARKIHGETIPVDGPYLNFTWHEPVGVIGQIVPWNYPLLIACWKIAPALACGNTVVLKPSELTPLTALRLADILQEAGVPAGVVNIITGYGPSAGEPLARHMDVDKLSFTGSTRTARALLQASAESNLKRLSLELGGKSPQIVFPDADLDAAAAAAFDGIFANKGEVCSAGSRLLVHADIHDAFVSRLVAKAKAMRVGDPLDAASEMGSQVSGVQLDKILGYCEAGQKEGATLAAGGHRLTDGALSKGFFMQPTIFTDVRAEMVIAQEEIFGPVLSVLSFRDEDEAVRLANSTVYGLVSAVWTKDMGRALRMAKRIKAGSVWLNMWNGFDSASPFGGYGQSGWGREMGVHALELYTETKSVWAAY
jgi:acyl-CoA reductase-like NAD-dependent aldehyde dehydrogenase